MKPISQQEILDEVRQDDFSGEYNESRYNLKSILFYGIAFETLVSTEITE